MTKCVWPVRPEDRLCKYCKCVHCSDRNRSQKRIGSVGTTMRNMKVGTTVRFDGTACYAARTAAWRMRKDNGPRFVIYTKENATYIERIS